jgi:hypothetical protein
LSLRKKIRRLVIFCLSAFILFNVVLLLFPLKKKYIYKDKERGEEYIYSNKTYPVVFAGSGLIGDFDNENLGRKAFYNLFFPYGGGCTAVQLVALSEKIPDTLFIETNYIFKGFNNELLGKLFNPVAYRSRFILPCLREINKPLPLAKEIFKVQIPRQKTMTILPEPLYQQSIESLKKEYSESDSAGFYNIIAKLKKQVDYISSRDCIIIFFEMPVDSFLLNSAKIKWEREMLRSTFSDKKFIWSHTDTCCEYVTSDGIHLLDKSLEKYIHYFNNSLEYK